jgi:mRNA interferase MazF
VKRGELWTVATRGDYTGKRRPVVIVQDDAFEETDSVVVCGLTTNLAAAPLFRINITPNERNGLRSQAAVMVDKITTVPRSRMRDLVGELDTGNLIEVERAMLVFLGLARAVRPRRRARAEP